MDRYAIINLALLGWFAVLAVAEFICAWRGSGAAVSSDERLVTNFTLTALVLLASAAFPFANLGSSMVTRRLNIGVGHLLALPWVMTLLLALLAMTFASYWVHRLMHAQPFFWRIHRVHHADSSVDVSTSLRNHPLELTLTMPVSALVIFIVGAPVSVVVVLQTLFVAAALWQHADIPLPRRLDQILSRVIITPRLHRLHHNPERPVHDSNYGELIVLWDWLFATLNVSEGRGRVGLDHQAARPDHLLEQIVSPLSAA